MAVEMAALTVVPKVALKAACLAGKKAVRLVAEMVDNLVGWLVD